MSEIVSLFTVFSPHLLATPLRQFCRIVFGVLAMIEFLHRTED